MDPSTIPPVITKLLTHKSSGNLLRPLSMPVILKDKSGSFAPALAHEVRNPLSNIYLAVEMLKSTIMDNDQKIYLDIIMRGSLRINDLVTDLLSSYQNDEIQPEKYSIHLLLDEALEMAKDRILLKNISTRKDYTTVDCKIIADKQKMKIAITNIIINAIDAMPPENGKLKLVTKSINGKCVIEISDNGVGISKENLQHIFKPYFTNKVQGFGLGLSTTQDILLQNHVKVNIQSVEGKGTLFILSFHNINES